ncbi:MAG: hypothetical protein QNK37_33095 [Acidobacteriota bacterium]|nr:hypothetical protein [Acidobacteriota bacterium]
MHPVQQFLVRSGHKILRQRMFKLFSMALSAITAYLTLYFISILVIKSMSLTWTGLFVVPALVVLALLVAIPFQWWQLRDPRHVARFLEHQHPELQLSVRTGLDFLDGRADHTKSSFHEPYLNQVNERLHQIYVHDRPSRPWGRYAVVAVAAALTMWLGFETDLRDKFYNPKMSFGQTHLDLSEGSITIFEPEYTQVPGRTLPLKSGNFSAYPGSKIRFRVQLPKGTSDLYLSNNEQEPVPLRVDEEAVASHEFLLLEKTELRFLLAEGSGSGRTSPFIFEVKQDTIPEVQLRGYTPEGPINVMDPLIIETEVRDDFGIKELEAVVNWDGGTRRIPITVPSNRKKHFIAKNQWYLSDFELGDADRFSIYLEAKDNNPINGPGVGISGTLTYELESPEKKYEEFMQLARELLDTMTHTLGDNLETMFARVVDAGNLKDAEIMGKQISNGLYRSLTLTNTLISKVRETPNLTRLDQNFLYQFRNGVSKQARARSEMGLLFSNIQYREQNNSYRKLVNAHRTEEIRVEDLTYELLLQLKMWAIFELERQNNKLQEEMDQMEELLENAENMEEEELLKMFNKLMDQLMKDFNEMMMKAAREMDQNMQEFMNNEAMQESTDLIEELKQQIMEALKAGDMEKAKQLMEALREQMQAAYQSMQDQVGEMSPEMQAMMQDMKELMGLLRETKNREEALEKATRNLKQRMDEQMGGNDTEMSEQRQQEYRKATENIHKMLTDLYNKLVDFKTEDLAENIVNQVAEYKRQLENPDLSGIERRRLQQEIANQERLLDFITRDGLDKLQNVTLRNISQTEKMQEYLDQGELLLSLESGNKLSDYLISGERTSERNASRKIREEAKPKETFQEARMELNEILNALQGMRNNMEEARRQFMEQQGSEDGQKLAQEQADINQMIEEFMQRTQESFGGSQIADKLREIGMSMRNAERKLGGSRLEGGINYQQDALQKIGEMMEQLQNSSRPSGRRPMPMMQRQGQWGDPSLEDIFIPESQKKASRDKVKDEIRKRLGKNLPEAYGKEIKKYYEKLMDQ